MDGKPWPFLPASPRTGKTGFGSSAAARHHGPGRRAEVDGGTVAR